MTGLSVVPCVGCTHGSLFSNPLVAEALALRDAAVFAVERSFNKVICEVDCSELVRHWHNRLLDRAL
jgi:hypothetical protein